MMASYRSYTHVERLEKPECEGLLQNDEVYISAKIDGTNAAVWYDSETKEVCGGSRTRKLTLEKDNASFYLWLRSGQEEAVALRKFVTANPECIVYGEWLGCVKFVGNIKTYNQDALRHMYIFDVFDTLEMHYLHEKVWREKLSYYNLDKWFVPILACLNHPSYEDVVKIAENNNFLLDFAENKGEGVVCKVPGWKNKYGNTCYGKIVLNEYREHKKNPKTQIKKEGIEADIVEYFVTDSELAKTKAKVCTICETDTFNIKSGKMIGMYLNITFNDLLQEMNAICKKWKNPIIDFSVLKNETFNKARHYIGLI